MIWIQFGALLVAVVGQTVLAHVMTDSLWFSRRRPFLSGLLQFAVACVPMIVVGGFITGVGTIMVAGIAGSEVDIDVLVRPGMPDQSSGTASQLVFGLFILGPYAYLLLRVRRLVGAARATLAWQQGKT